MANSFKQQQQNKRESDQAALVLACRSLAHNGSRVEAVNKYRAATGASLKVAQQALFGN